MCLQFAREDGAEDFPDGCLVYKIMEHVVCGNYWARNAIVTPWCSATPRGLTLEAEGAPCFFESKLTHRTLGRGAIHCLRSLSAVYPWLGMNVNELAGIHLLTFECRGFGYIAHNDDGHVAFRRIEFVRRVA